MTLKHKTTTSKTPGNRPKVIRPAKLAKASVTPPVAHEPVLEAETAPEGAMDAALFAQTLSVGHRPSQNLSVQDSELFRAFQSNLLSLISHELRTPLMGVLNALAMLKEGKNGGEALALDEGEIIKMAQLNAQRLSRALSSILDVASIESGNFHVHLKEASLFRLVSSRAAAHKKSFQERGVTIELEDLAGDSARPVLADPQRLGRAIDLLLEVVAGLAKNKAHIKLRISSSRADLLAALSPEEKSSWLSQWKQSLAALQGGVGSPTSAFGGVIQSEQAFLSRSEEGLGSELLLIHEIMKVHQGAFESKDAVAGHTGLTQFSLILPELSNEESLRAVLKSRAYEVSHELSTVALIVVSLPPHEKTADVFRAKLKKNLFRSSDAVYGLEDPKKLAVVITDCNEQDVPKLISRMESALGYKLTYGMAHCPSDGLDPSALIEVANNRLSATAAAE